MLAGANVFARAARLALHGRVVPAPSEKPSRRPPAREVGRGSAAESLNENTPPVTIGGLSLPCPSGWG
ncbi:hypothetical protein GGTG_05627 [Gaeumannomyces tritici R3-111a-1]|uniref:Uncharacterized protein n=1 Tax=Gaeumannomyces tritici (strain R3-111a-1) TaxID=644352 RepID=J3NWG3_GAET3|nr:hypothetical protein GGTG_05627 [Gaeumannomyces tritici R3-111a-1]EJT75695.1 hypothetical protein GGTG_05627 [Gaeumannomyces tritici R3-111a-1]